MPRDDENADAPAVTGQRQCRRGAHLGCLGARTPCQRTLVVQEIVADAYLPIAKGLPANSGTFGGIGHDRNVNAAQARNVVATAGGEAQEKSVAGSCRKMAAAQNARWKTRLRRPSRTAFQVILRTKSLRWWHSTPRMSARYRSSPSPGSLGQRPVASAGSYAGGGPKCSLLASGRCNSE